MSARRVATVIAGMTVAVALAIPAGAADLRSRPPAMLSEPVYDWSGFYVGGNFGGAFNREDVATPIGTFSTDPSGVLGGFQAGYNFIFSPNWLLGFEGEFDLTSAQGTVNFSTPVTAFSAFSNHNWYGMVTGRVGYVTGPWVFYAKGGGAWMNADYKLAVNSGLGGAATVSPDRTGWTIGGGAEYFYLPGWSAKLEYSFLDFGSSANSFAFAGLGVPLTFTTRVHEVKAGVNYHFGWSWGPWPSAMPTGRF